MKKTLFTVLVALLLVVCGAAKASSELSTSDSGHADADSLATLSVGARLTLKTTTFVKANTPGEWLPPFPEFQSFTVGATANPSIPGDRDVFSTQEVRGGCAISVTPSASDRIYQAGSVYTLASSPEADEIASTEAERRELLSFYGYVPKTVLLTAISANGPVLSIFCTPEYFQSTFSVGAATGYGVGIREAPTVARLKKAFDLNFPPPRIVGER